MNAFSSALALLLALPVAANSRGNLRGQLDASCKDFNAPNAYFGDICHNLRHMSQSQSKEWCDKHGDTKIFGDTYYGNSANFRCCTCGGGDTFTDDLIRGGGVVQLPPYQKEFNKPAKLHIQHLGRVSGTVKGLVKVKEGKVKSLKMGPVFLGAVELDLVNLNFVIPLKISGVSATCTAKIEIRSEFCSEICVFGACAKECPVSGNFNPTVEVPLKDGSLDVTVKGVAKIDGTEIKIDGRPTIDDCASSINVDEGGVRISRFDWSDKVVIKDVIASGAQKAEDAARENICDAVKEFAKNTDKIKNFLEQNINSQSISSA